MSRNSELNKMLLLPPEVYEKLKNDIEYSRHRTIFDKAIEKILKDYKKSETEKWYNYRNQLVAFSNLRRRAREVRQPYSKRNLNMAKLHDKASQTKYVLQNTTSMQTDGNKSVEYGTQTDPINAEDIFETETDMDSDKVFGPEKTPTRQSLSQSEKRRLSASGIAKSLKQKSKVAKASEKDYQVITADDGITQYTIPTDMSIDEIEEMVSELDQPQQPSTSRQERQSILKPSLLDPKQQILNYPIRKLPTRQSERVKALSGRSQTETQDVLKFWKKL